MNAMRNLLASRKWLVTFSVALALLFLSTAWIGVIAAARSIERQAQSGAPDMQRERELEPDAPTISFIESPSPTCSRPIEGTNVCYIEWAYFGVNAGSDYMITMTLSIDGKIRANTQGFFQNSMYLPGNLFAKGFQVACGVPGASGNPTLGQTYNYTLRARDSLGLGAASYGSLTCPADVVSIARLDLSGPATGKMHTLYTFDATLFPITTTLPVTYTWLASDTPSQTVVDGVANSQSILWDSPGAKTITVEARNHSSFISQSLTILIELHKLYLPLLKR